MTIHLPSNIPTTSGVIAPNEGAPPTLSPGPAVPRPTTTARIPLDAIIERPDCSLDLRPERIDRLAISIAAVGLKQPLVLLADHRLVNGRHRLHALRALRERDPQDFLVHFPDAMIPIEVVDLGQEPSSSAFRDYEVVEAPVFVDYTNAELVRAVEYLVRKGYSKKRGRPAKGELRVGPMLRDAFGLTPSAIARALTLVRNPDKLVGEPSRTSRLAAAKRALAKIDHEDLPELVALIDELRLQQAA